jgi:anti-sigma B factor antagonist
MVTGEMKLEGIDVLTLEGRFDAHTVPAANKWLEEVTTKLPPQVVVNMEDVNFVDSAGLATLVKGMKRSRELGGNLVIFGLQQPVRIIFELTRLDKAIDIFDNEESAIAAFGDSYVVVN